MNKKNVLAFVTIGTHVFLRLAAKAYSVVGNDVSKGILRTPQLVRPQLPIAIFNMLLTFPNSRFAEVPINYL